MRRRWPYRPYFGGSVATMGGLDADVILWRDAVVTNGGTVSAARLSVVDTFIRAEKASGTWTLTDDYWGFWAENAVQALTSLKQRRLATAVNSPTFTANAGYAFDGVTNYIDTGFIPGTHAVAMTGADMRLAVYERTNSNASRYAAGAYNSSTRNNLVLPRDTSNQITIGANCLSNFGTITDSRGYTSVYRTPASVFGGYKNGLSAGTVVPGASSTVLASIVLLIGCFNNAGTPASFRQAEEGLVVIGASLSGAQELAQYNAVQAWATAIGAQV